MPRACRLFRQREFSFYENKLTSTYALTASFRKVHVAAVLHAMFGRIISVATGGTKKYL